MKIQLIHPPEDSDYELYEASYLKSPPVGLALLAGSLRGIRGVSVEVIDGDGIGFREILGSIDGDIVGVSDWYSKHRNSLRILESAKEKGARTIIGGPNTVHLAERILRNHPFVDYAIAGDGEVTLPLLAKGMPPGKIPNLVFRDGKGIVRNPVKDGDMELLFDLDDITNLRYDRDRLFPISSIRGCIKAETGGRCVFCSMVHKLRIMRPALVWKQIGLLREKYGIRRFWETGDSFVVGNYPEKLLDARPDGLGDVEFRIYASPDQIDRRTADVLRKLNVREVFLGIESLDNGILKTAGKPYLKTDITNAIDILLSRGIIFQLPFMYGLPGETEETARKTYEFAREMLGKYPETRMLASLPIPLIGTGLFDMLRKDGRARKEYPGDLDRDDYFDYDALTRLQTKYFTKISYEKLNGFVEKTRNLKKDRTKWGAFGVTCRKDDAD